MLPTPPGGPEASPLAIVCERVVVVEVSALGCCAPSASKPTEASARFADQLARGSCLRPAREHQPELVTKFIRDQLINTQSRFGQLGWRHEAGSA